MKVSKHLLLSGALAASLATSAVLPTLSVFAGEAGQSNQASQSKTYQAAPDKGQGQEGPRQQAGDHCQGHDRGPGGHHQGHEGHEQGSGGHGQEKKEGQSTQNVQINVTMKQALEKAATQVPNGQVLGASLYDQGDQATYSVVVKADKDFRFVFVDAQSGKVTEEETNQEQSPGHDRQGPGQEQGANQSQAGDQDRGPGQHQDQGQAPAQGQDKGPDQAPGQDQGPGQDQAPAQGQAPNQNQGPEQGQKPAPGLEGSQAQGQEAKPEFKAPSVSAQAALDAVLAKYADAKVYDIELTPSHEQDKAAAYTVTLESNQTYKQVTVDGETAAVTEVEAQEEGHQGPADHQEGQAQGPGQEGDRGQHQGPNQNQAGPGSGQAPDKQEVGPQGQPGAPAESNKR